MADAGRGSSIAHSLSSQCSPLELNENLHQQLHTTSLQVDQSSPVIAHPGAMDRPIFEPDFVSTKAFIECKALVDKPSDASAFVFTGPAGSGKTTLAKELCSYLWHEKHSGNESRVLFRQLNCTHLETLYSDLRLFYDDIGQPRAKLSVGEKSWDIIQTLYSDMNSSYPQRVKIIILDDAENMDGVLKAVNHICKILRPELREYWKLFVTSQKNPFFEGTYSAIGESRFYKINGFDQGETKELFKYSELDPSTVKKIRDTLGPLPLALKISMASLKSNQLDDTKESVDNLLRDIETETSALIQSGRENRLDSALIAIKISIDRLVAELPFAEECMQVIKIITFFDEKNISSELLIACAEMFKADSQQATMMVRHVTSRLLERCLCTKKVENKVPLFSLHKLVQQSMKLFVKEEEKLSLLQNALIALTRVMPKDGRKHQTRLVSFYAAHGITIDKVLNCVVPATDPQRQPFITLMHCQMLTSLGYCQLAQRNDYDSGIERLKQARNEYCQLVLNQDYNFLLPEAESRMGVELQEVQIANQLYDGSQDVPGLFNSMAYKDYIAHLPLYHRLTKKDISYMVDFQLALINDHLTTDQFHVLKQKGKILNAELMEKVYLGEVLAQIYCVWSKGHSRIAGYGSMTAECLRVARAAVDVFASIQRDHNVYLLSSLITERDLLSSELKKAETEQEVKRIISRFEVLEEIATDPTRQNAYEAGLMRSDLSNDQYHRLLCAEAILTGRGRLFSLTNDERHYLDGKNLFSMIEAMAKDQVNPHSTLSHSYRKFAHFLSHCKRYGEAVVYILKGMMELKRSVVHNNDKGTENPEIDHQQFRYLYSDIESYYDKFVEQRRDIAANSGDHIHKNEEKLLTEDMPEYEYLKTVVAGWRSFGMNNMSNQPADSSNRFMYLEYILEWEVQELSMGVGVATKPHD